MLDQECRDILITKGPRIVIEDMARAWVKVWDYCIGLGMKPQDNETGLDCMKKFIKSKVS